MPASCAEPIHIRCIPGRFEHVSMGHKCLGCMAAGAWVQFLGGLGQRGPHQPPQEIIPATHHAKSCLVIFRCFGSSRERLRRVPFKKSPVVFVCQSSSSHHHHRHLIIIIISSSSSSHHHLIIIIFSSSSHHHHHHHHHLSPLSLLLFLFFSNLAVQPLSGKVRVECQKLMVFCDFWGSRKCSENCACNSFCLIRPFFRERKNKRKSPKTVKNWGFLAIFSCLKQPSAGIRLLSVKNCFFFAILVCPNLCLHLFCLIRPSSNSVLR